MRAGGSGGLRLRATPPGRGQRGAETTRHSPGQGAAGATNRERFDYEGVLSSRIDASLAEF